MPDYDLESFLVQAHRHRNVYEQAFEKMAERFERVVEPVIPVLPSDWIQRNFYVSRPRDPETGEVLPPGPIRLAAHQIEIINEALSRDEDGKFNYVTVIYSGPKKSGKSALSAAVAKYLGHTHEYGNIYCLANDGKQSSDRLYQPIYNSYQLHRRLNGPFSHVRPLLTELVIPDTKTKIEAVPCDAAGEAGSEPLATFWSEMWGFDSEAKTRLFCFDPETEILTRRGWCTYDQLREEDEYLTLNPDTLEQEWQRARAVYVFQHTGEMFTTESEEASIWVTRGHRFYGRSHPENKDEIQVVEQIMEMPEFWLRASARPQVGEVIAESVIFTATEDMPEIEVGLLPYLRLFGWFMRAGHIQSSSHISFKALGEVHEIAEELGLQYTLGDGEIIVYDSRLVRKWQIYDTVESRRVPQWIKELPPVYLRAFVYAFLVREGYGDYFTLYAPSAGLRDDLAEMGVRLGHRVQDVSGADQYRLRLTDIPHWVVKHPQWVLSDENPSGTVWCPSTANGIVMVRRHNTYYFSGNTEMTIPPTLYGYALRWIESYAGFMGKSNLLWSLYETGVKEGTPHPAFDHLRGIDGEPVVYVNEAARMLTYWDTKPRMVWQSPEYYESEAKILSPSEFQRIHRNQWQSPTGSFTAPELWDHCGDPSLPPLVKGSRVPCIVGIDAAVSKDCAAIVLVTRDPNFPETDVAIRKARIFKPPEGHKINLETTIGRTLREYLNDYNVVCVVYDEFQMTHMIQNYQRGKVIIDESEVRNLSETERDAYIKKQQDVVQTWYVSFGQQNSRARADKQLHDLIMNKQIHYNPYDQNEDIAARGDEETISKHIKQAGSKVDKEESRLRLEKISKSAHIDGAVAVSMAASQCLRLNLDSHEFDVEDVAQQLARGEITFDQFQEIMRLRRARLVRGVVGEE